MHTCIRLTCIATTKNKQHPLKHITTLTRNHKHNTTDFRVLHFAQSTSVRWCHPVFCPAQCVSVMRCVHSCIVYIYSLITSLHAAPVVPVVEHVLVEGVSRAVVVGVFRACMRNTRTIYRRTPQHGFYETFL